MNDDGELLRQFAETKNEACFALLVQKRIGFVYAICVRRLRDHHAAQDATQAVFVALARKARAVGQGPNVMGWLHRSACYETNNIVRARANQLARETEAERLGTTAPESQHEPKLLEAILDEALLQLPKVDREAILARYFSGYSYAKLGAALQLSDNGARMRVDRAMLKLRSQLALRGFTSTALVLSEAMPAFASTAVPGGLTVGVTKAAMLSIAAGTGGVAAMIGFMSTAKIVIGVALVAAIGGALYEFRQVAALKQSLAKAQSASATSSQQLRTVEREVDNLRKLVGATTRTSTSSSVPRATKPASPGVTPKPPKGWFKNGSATNLYEVGVDENNSWGGMPSAYAKSTGVADGKFGGMMQSISADAYQNQRVRLNGWIKTDGADDGGGHLWMRVDGQQPNQNLGFDNMAGRAPVGTTDWQEYSIVLDVPTGATKLNYGFFVEGNGQMWVNGVTITPVSAEVPTTAQPNTPTNLGFAPPTKN